MNKHGTSTSTHALYSAALRTVLPKSITAYREALRIAREIRLDRRLCQEFLEAAVEDGIIEQSDAAVIWRGVTNSCRTPFDGRRNHERM